MKKKNIPDLNTKKKLDKIKNRKPQNKTKEKEKTQNETELTGKWVSTM